MPDTERKPTTTHTAQYLFNCEQTDEETGKAKTLTKSFTGYNTALNDDALSTVGNKLVENAIFAGDDQGAIISVKKITRVDTTKTPVDLSSIMPAEATQTA